MITKRKVKKFVDKFGKFLYDGMVGSDFEYCETNSKESDIEYKTYDFIFQIFGRHVEQELGIKFFDKEKGKNK